MVKWAREKSVRNEGKKRKHLYLRDLFNPQEAIGCRWFASNATWKSQLCPCSAICSSRRHTKTSAHMLTFANVLITLAYIFFVLLFTQSLLFSFSCGHKYFRRHFFSTVHSSLERSLRDSSNKLFLLSHFSTLVSFRGTLEGRSHWVTPISHRVTSWFPLKHTFFVPLWVRKSQLVSQSSETHTHHFMWHVNATAMLLTLRQIFLMTIILHKDTGIQKCVIHVERALLSRWHKRFSNQLSRDGNEARVN